MVVFLFTALCLVACGPAATVDAAVASADTLAAGSDSSSTPAAVTTSDSTLGVPASRPIAPSDSAHVPRIVRVFEEVVVRAPLHDPYSSESVHLVTQDLLRRLPIDDFAGALSAKAGVVVQAGDLHVRGGRSGDAQLLLAGVPLGEPRRGRAMEVPFLAIANADLVSGALDAEYGGALAGVVDLRTVDPPDHLAGEARWQTDGGANTRYDQIGARIGGPIPRTGLGFVVTGEATLDDTNLPALRSVGRSDWLGGSYGWRADNRLLGHAKLATRGHGSRLSLEVLGSRIVDQPFDPMWSLDGYTKPSGDPLAGEFGPQFRPDPTPGYSRYRAADHLAMTDDRRLAAVLSWTRPWQSQQTTLALGWVGDKRLTSVGGSDNESYLEIEHSPVFGIPDWPTSDPFYIYQGDEPFFQRSHGSVLTLRADHAIPRRSGSRLQFGVGGTYTEVALRELDTSTRGLALDSLRAYSASAPGGFAYAQTRWVFEGMVLNAGLRGEVFTAGHADHRSLDVESHPIATLSPRFGIAFPISVRDVLSFAYVRIQQDPGRDFLYDNRRVISNRQPIGNPALEPATVISYQAAVKHVMNPRWASQAAFFYRDLFGQIGQRSENIGAGVERPVYTNADEGHAGGFELSLLRTGDDRGLFEFHYTYMQAWGTQSLEEGTPYGVRVGARPGPISEHPLDWDRRHSIVFAGERRRPGVWSYGWITALGTGLPWTPRSRRQLDADFSRVNTGRFKWDESTSLSAHWLPPWLGSRASLGLEVRNLFDHRSETAATVNGYPQPEINTVYDDYGAYRAETGHSGGAFWDDVDGDGRPGWVAVHDPRLFQAPRTLRVTVSTSW